MTTDIEKLKESMHALVTPEFTGTHEEMISAVGYWVSMISQLRSLFTIISSFDNRAAIINQLEKEIAIMKAELDNLSAKVNTDGNGLPSMGQPAPINAPAIEIEPGQPTAPTGIALAVQQEAQMQRMRANAGVQSNIKVHPLSRIG
jgi:hypothetical protein